MKKQSGPCNFWKKASGSLQKKQSGPCKKEKSNRVPAWPPASSSPPHRCIGAVAAASLLPCSGGGAIPAVLVLAARYVIIATAARPRPTVRHNGAPHVRHQPWSCKRWTTSSTVRHKRLSRAATERASSGEKMDMWAATSVARWGMSSPGGSSTGKGSWGKVAGDGRPWGRRRSTRERRRSVWTLGEEGEEAGERGVFIGDFFFTQGF